jgi:hypothetical protein
LAPGDKKNTGLDALFEQAMQLAGLGGSAPKPLGVPKGYTAPGGTLGGTIIGGRGVAVDLPTAPRYYDGDQYLPASQSPAQIAELQRALEAGGWYGAKATIVYGRWDPATAKAYQAALSSANQGGKTIDQVLNESILTTAAAGGQAKAGPTQIPVRKVSNPADLRDIFTDSAKKYIGHNPNPEDVDSMVLAYQAMRIAPQDQANDVQWQEAQMAQAGGGRGAPVTITEAQDPTTYAKEELKKRYPWQYAATEGAQVAQSALDFIMGGQ